jgi:hypothetical protein
MDHLTVTNKLYSTVFVLGQKINVTFTLNSIIFM